MSSFSVETLVLDLDLPSEEEGNSYSTKLGDNSQNDCKLL